MGCGSIYNTHRTLLWECSIDWDVWVQMETGAHDWAEMVKFPSAMFVAGSQKLIELFHYIVKSWTNVNQDNLEKFFLEFRSKYSIISLPQEYHGSFVLLLVDGLGSTFPAFARPHLLSISRSSQFTMAFVHFETTTSWLMPYFYVNIAPSSPAWSPFPRQSNHANPMAGWRRVEVAPQILWCTMNVWIVVLWHCLDQHIQGVFLVILVYQSLDLRGELT